MRRFKRLLASDTLMLGLAMFCMFFGAGNVIFPIYLGQICQDSYLYGFIGLFLTAVVIPFVGVFAMILFDGKTQPFFGRFGKHLGLFIAGILMILLGPLGSTPRCIALSFSSFKSFFPTLDANVFILFVSILLYFATKNREIMMNLLGRFITPILIALLAFIIALGIFSNGNILQNVHSASEGFLIGVKEGYNTMDLLAAFFFSSSIIHALKQSTASKQLTYPLFKKAITASLIGALLLSLTYLGFAHLSAKHAGELIGVSKEMLLNEIMVKLMGSNAAFMVAVVVSLACLTTAMALLAVFVEFLKNEVKLSFIKEGHLLIGSIAITAMIARLEFTGISKMLTPILSCLYPVLIALTAFHILEHLLNRKQKRAISS